MTCKNRCLILSQMVEKYTMSVRSVKVEDSHKFFVNRQRKWHSPRAYVSHNRLHSISWHVDCEGIYLERVPSNKSPWVIFLSRNRSKYVVS